MSSPADGEDIAPDAAAEDCGVSVDTGETLAVEGDPADCGWEGSVSCFEA